MRGLTVEKLKAADELSLNYNVIRKSDLTYTIVFAITILS